MKGMNVDICYNIHEPWKHMVNEKKSQDAKEGRKEGRVGGKERGREEGRREG